MMAPKETFPGLSVSDFKVNAWGGYLLCLRNKWVVGNYSSLQNKLADLFSSCSWSTAWSTQAELEVLGKLPTSTSTQTRTSQGINNLNKRTPASPSYQHQFKLGRLHMKGRAQVGSWFDSSTSHGLSESGRPPRRLLTSLSSLALTPQLWCIWWGRPIESRGYDTIKLLTILTTSRYRLWRWLLFFIYRLCCNSLSEWHTPDIIPVKLFILYHVHRAQQTPLPAFIFQVSRRNFLSGSFKAVFKDDKVVDRRAGRGIVSELSLVNLNPFGLSLAWSSSKVRIVRLGLSTLIGSCFLHDVHMHQTMRIKITPHNVTITERVRTPESCKHMNPKAIRKNTMLSQKHKT